MSASKEQLIEFMKRQIANENKIVNSVNAGIKNFNNAPVKAVLKGISLDSVKHAELYASAIVLLTTTSQAMNQENLDEQRELVEKHIKMESELIEKTRRNAPCYREQESSLPPRFNIK